MFDPYIIFTAIHACILLLVFFFLAPEAGPKPSETFIVSDAVRNDCKQLYCTHHTLVVERAAKRLCWYFSFLFFFFYLRVLRARPWRFGSREAFLCCRWFALFFFFVVLIAWADATELGTWRCATLLGCIDIGTQQGLSFPASVTIPSPKIPNHLNSFLSYYLVTWSTDATVYLMLVMIACSLSTRLRPVSTPTPRLGVTRRAKSSTVLFFFFDFVLLLRLRAALISIRPCSEPSPYEL